MYKDEVHRSALFKALSDEHKGIPSVIKNMIVEKNLDRLIVLAGLTPEYVRGCDLSEGHTRPNQAGMT